MGLAKNNINDVLQIIEQSSTPFKYHSNVDVKAHKSNANLSIQEVNYLYDQDKITLSDLHIAKKLASHVFSTPRQVAGTIDFENNNFPEDDQVPMLKDIENVRYRLNELCNVGIVKKYTFNAISENGELKKSSYYIVSPHGYNYIKRIVNFKGNYDEYLSVQPPEEVFKYLSINTVINAFYKHHSFRGFKNDIRFYSKQTKQKSQFYSIIKTKSELGENRICVEPLKFRYNQNRISKNEWRRQILERLEILKEYIKAGDDSRLKKYILFLVEDIQGAQIASTLIDKHLRDLRSIVYITSDSMVFRTGIENSFMQVVEGDGDDISIKHIIPPFL